MKTASLLVLFVAAAVMRVQAQEIKVIRLSGQVDQFSLAEIDSVTFSVHDSTATSTLRVGSLGTNDILCIHTYEGIFRLSVTEIDSMCFVDGNVIIVYQGSGVTNQFNLAEVDSMTFSSSSASTVFITYSDDTATVSNPLEDAGVEVDVAGADVTILSTAGFDGIAYVLSGTTTDGMCKIYSDSDFTLVLNGAQITNLDGPAINIQADEEATVELASGTTSIMTDGLTYEDPPNDEDQKAAFFSEGQLIFAGSGSLIVHGRGEDQHGLGSDDCIDVHSGSIVIQSAAKDGIHTNEGYYQHGGSAAVTSESDGVDAGNGPVEITGGSLTVLNQDDDRDALKCDGELQIAGGVLDITVEGDQSKGLDAPDILLMGGTVTIHTSGGMVLEPSGSGYDPSYCTAVKADNQVLLDGCQLAITTSGVAGRGISSDGDILIQTGSLSIACSGGGGTYTNEEGQMDAYFGPCLKANGDLVLGGGMVTLSHSGSGGKGISTDGNITVGTAESSPTLHITTTGQPISIGGGEYAEAKAISADSLITIHNGELTISSADDAIKSKYWININGGLINIPNSVEGLESPNLFINGGELHITSTDDGLNATYGNDVEQNDGSNLTISGGYVRLNALSGDGIDSNGNITISGGTIIVHGPPSPPEVGLDVNGSFIVSGGLLVVSQVNSHLVEAPANQSTQRSALLLTDMTIPAGALFHIEDAIGNSLLTFAPVRNYSAILLSSPGLISGTIYRVYTGGGCTGAEQDGLYTGGTYSGGTLRTTFTSSGIVQIITF